MLNMQSYSKCIVHQDSVCIRNVDCCWIFSKYLKLDDNWYIGMVDPEYGSLSTNDPTSRRCAWTVCGGKKPSPADGFAVLSVTKAQSYLEGTFLSFNRAHARISAARISVTIEMMTYLNRFRRERSEQPCKPWTVRWGFRPHSSRSIGYSTRGWDYGAELDIGKKGYVVRPRALSFSIRYALLGLLWL